MQEFTINQTSGVLDNQNDAVLKFVERHKLHWTCLVAWQATQ